MLLIGTRKGLWTLTPDAEREGWELGEPEFLGHIVHHAVARPARRPDRLLPASAPGTSARRSSAPTTGVARGREASSPPAFAAPGPCTAGRSTSVLAHAGPRRASPASGTPAARRRACSAPRTAASRGRRSPAVNDHPQLGDVGRGRQDEHARRLEAALDHRRPARPDAPLPRACRAAACSSRTDGGAAGRRSTQRRASADFLPEPDADVRPRPALRAALHPRCPTASTSRTTAASTGSTGRRRRWERIGDNMPQRRRRHRLPDRAAPARPGHGAGCSRWTAPTSGRARAPTAGRRRTSRATPARSWTRLRTRACPSAGVVHGQAPGHDGRRRATRSASTSAPPAARSGRAATRARAGRSLAAHLPEIYSVECGAELT